MSFRREIEAKFYCPDLEAIRDRVLSEGGDEIAPRVRERNLRFDTAGARLMESKELLRLRQDRRVTLAYKRQLGQIQEREELEVEIDDFRTARALLEALDFQVIFIYEKYRQVFALDSTTIMLDELPFGHFAEVEGPSREHIRRVCQRLGLDWEQRLGADYHTLFRRLSQARDLPHRDATFDKLSGLPAASPEELEDQEQVHPTGKVE
jgi:predicted adenylyl cyclase CyaB